MYAMAIKKQWESVYLCQAQTSTEGIDKLLGEGHAFFPNRFGGS